MSAIAGIHFSDERPLNHRDLCGMLSTMRHRGPDRIGSWCHGSVGLGHCLLWTTPESLHESLPTWNASSQLAITADCRIDNRDDLLASLELPYGNGREIPDSQLILWAYERWGERCPERLLGDFAFAIWDSAKQTLFCARDHFGVKPFYYHHSNKGFFFASEIKALLYSADVPCRLNEARLADFLASNFQDTSATFYLDILRLPPAHSLTVRGNHAALRRYWNLDPACDIRCRSDEEYAEGFRTIFTEAVRARMRTTFAIGSMLSGGLDSSSIFCVARQLLDRRDDRKMHTFSVVFPNAPECDESPYIRAVLDGGGLEPHFVNAQKLSPLGNMGRMLRHEDEPFFAPNLFLHWALYEAAHEQGVRVILDGIDGDTTVSHGIGILQELARKGRWITLSREILGLSRRFNRPPWGILKHHVLRPLFPEKLRRLRHMIGARRRPAPALSALLSRKFDSRIRQTHTEESTPRHEDVIRTARQDHYRSLTRGLIPYCLEVADHAAAAFSMEPRYPFFDKRLAEYCLALPIEQKISRGWTRMVMRRGMANILPEKVRWRGGKSDLSPNFLRSLIANERAVLDELIRSPAARVWEFVDSETLQSLHRRALSSDDRDAALALWKVAILESWLKDSKPRFQPRQEGNDNADDVQIGPGNIAAMAT